jgi:hypothetical protein
MDLLSSSCGTDVRGQITAFLLDYLFQQERGA